MRGTALVFLLCAASRAQDPDPAALLGRIKTRAEENLRKLPDYTCAQTVERLWRDKADRPYKAIDTLRLEVALIDGQERFSWLDSRRFEEKSLADLIGGASGTGSFALHAGSVFRPRVADFTFGGAESFRERPAFRYDYEVPRERSRYRLRVGDKEAVVAFRGSFWVSAESLDLLRLEVHAEEIPPELGLHQASDFVEYQRAQLGHSEFLLPGSSELIMVDQYGNETRNRTQYSRCRQYLAESRLVATSAETTPASSARTEAFALAPRTMLELALESEIEPEKTAVGDAVRAILDKPLKDGDRIVVARGASVLGRVLRVEKESRPFPHYIVALQFHSLETGDGSVAFSATMDEAGPAAGLMREQKSMNPVFTRNRAPRMNILVAETQRGQGILMWEAKRPRIPRGLRMKWMVDAR